MSACPPLWTGGPDPAGYYSFPQRQRQPDAANRAPQGVNKRTMYPITTGTSVFGLEYKDGVVLAADTLGSYGSMARFNNLPRVIRLNETTLVACSGDYADFQHLTEILEQKQIEEEMVGSDGASQGDTMSPKALHCWLTRFLYNKRSKFDPLWTTLIVGGIQDGKPFLGYVNMIGVAFTERAIATGIGADLAVPVFRNALEKKPASELSLEEAKELVRSVVRLCFFRDCRASSKFNMAVVSKDGAVVEEPEELNVDNSYWQYAKQTRGFD